MKANRLSLFAIVTVILVVAAILVARQDAPQSSREKEFLFPDIGDKINGLSEIIVQSKGESLSLVKQDDQWLVKEADNYPAKFEKIKQTAVAVTDLRILAEKTSKAELYQKLGVEDPQADDANSTLLTFRNDEQNQLLSLIVGDTRQSKAAGGKPGLYVRLTDSDRALLVEGELAPSLDANDWFERDLLNINAKRIQAVLVQHSDDSSIQLQRGNEADELILEDIPVDRTVNAAAIGRIPALLESIYIDNVKADNNQLANETSIITTVKTFDGLVATVNSAEIDDTNYIKLAFAYEKPQTEETEVKDGEENTDTDESIENSSEKIDVRQEAEKLNKLVGGWIYEVPNYKFELFRKNTEDFLEDVEDEDSDK